jgi:hypothetical protein
MPLKQCGRLDEECVPDRARQQPARGREEDPVRRRQRRSTGAPAQDRHLVAQHHDLQFLELGGAQPQNDQLQHALEHNVPGGQEHDASESQQAPATLPTIEFLHPTRSSIGEGQLRRPSCGTLRACFGRSQGQSWGQSCSSGDAQRIRAAKPMMISAPEIVSAAPTRSVRVGACPSIN